MLTAQDLDDLEKAYQNLFKTPTITKITASRLITMARRYLYLRNSVEGIEFRDTNTGCWRSDCPTGDALDAIIDAALEGERKI